MLDSRFISICYMTKVDQNSIRLPNINKPGSVFMPLILSIIWHQAFVEIAMLIFKGYVFSIHIALLDL